MMDEDSLKILKRTVRSCWTIKDELGRVHGQNSQEDLTRTHRFGETALNSRKCLLFYLSSVFRVPFVLAGPDDS
jgi:hypothetical protein